MSHFQQGHEHESLGHLKTVRFLDLSLPILEVGGEQWSNRISSLTDAMILLSARRALARLITYPFLRYTFSIEEMGLTEGC